MIRVEAAELEIADLSVKVSVKRVEQQSHRARFHGYADVHETLAKVGKAHPVAHVRIEMAIG